MSDHAKSVEVVSADEIDRRLIPPSAFIADTEAFIDVRLPGSVGKASYSFIGPGVSQNADQKINLTEPHGFNVGAASMPHGTINNPHMHYTAEVFVCTRGKWEIRLGQHGEETFEIGPDTVFSAPTWTFRGFANVGDDDGWLFAVLGGDDTGGILWAPQVLEAAAETGLHLTVDQRVVDSSELNGDDELIEPLDAARLAQLDTYTAEDAADFLVAPSTLEWSTSALLSSVIPGHQAAMAPVIGHGMSQHRHGRPPITTPHGFTLEWLEIEPGATTGSHRIDESQVLLIVDGDWNISFNLDHDRLDRSIPVGSVVSVPAGAWRNLINAGDRPARCVVVCGGDARPRIDWHPTIIEEAAERGWSLDASGYIAATDLLGRVAQ